MERRNFLRLTTGTIAALGAGVALSGCNIAEDAAAGAVFNPATETWLSDLAKQIGANVLTSYLQDGINRAVGYFRSWFDGVTSQVDNNYETFWEDCYGHEIPPVMLVQVSKYKYPNPSNGDPLRDGMLACVNGGDSAVYFKPWAWQALSMYVHQMTTGLSGQNLANAQRVCVMGLAPSGTRPVTGGSPDNFVEWMTYDTRSGPVEIGKLEGTNGQYLATVKASGIWNANQQPLVQYFTLPTTVA